MMLLSHQNLYGGFQEYSCRIPHQDIINSKVHYITLIISHITHDLVVFKLRYSDFQQFNEKLEKALSQFRLPVLLPQFPGKKLFGSTNKSLKSIVHRRLELQDFMNLVLQIDKLYSLPIVKKMLPAEGERTSIEKSISQEEIDPLQNFAFQIESYQQLDDIVLYFIKVKDNVNNNCWRFKTRYSDLRDIHFALKEQKHVCMIPEFPKRKIFGITNENPNKIETRKHQLEDYLNHIFRIKEFHDNEVLTYFIENSKRESQRLQKFDEQKMMAKLKIKAQQIGEKNKTTTEKKIITTKQLSQSKRGLYMIKETKAQSEEDGPYPQKREDKLDKIEEILSQFDD